MKKIIPLILFFVLLTSCSKKVSSSSDSPSSNPSSETEPEPDPEPEPVEKDLFYQEDIKAFCEDKLVQKVNNGVSTAIGTYSGRYEENGVVISIEVEDSNLMTVKDSGYSDNVEIEIQAYNSSSQLAYHTYNFLISGNGSYWLKRWDNGFKDFIPETGDFRYSFDILPYGYKAEAFFSYHLLNISKENGFGNVRSFFLMRNRASESINIYEELDILGSTYGEPNTWFVLNKDNKMTRTDFEQERFDDEYKGIFDNLASVNTSLQHYNTYVGAPAFTVSNWCLGRFGLPNELLNSSYIRGAKNGPIDVEIQSNGNLVVAANAFNSELNDALFSDGWTLLKSKCRDLLSYEASNSSDYKQLVNYYYKPVTAGQNISLNGEWLILFAKKDNALARPAYLNGDIYLSSEAVNDDFYSEDVQECTVGPNIIASQNGRLFTHFTLGGPYEPHEYNYWYIAYSDDDGQTWVRAAIIDSWVNQIVKGKKDGVIFESNINLTDNNELFLFISIRENVNNGQTTGCLTGYVTIKNIEQSPSNWVMSEFKEIGVGFFPKNTYRVISNGAYLVSMQDATDDRYGLIYASFDKGVTWEPYSEIYSPQTYSYDEGIIMEKDDGTLWITFRSRKQHMYQSFSKDGGKTWSISTKYFMPNTDTRFCIKELPNGDWIMVYNNSQSGRTNMTLAISNDEGKSWTNKILLHERACSYPDIYIKGNDIHIVFDDGRYKSCAWRYEDDGHTLTWGYIYHYSININELYQRNFYVLPIEDLDVITRCRELGINSLEGDGTSSNPYLIKKAIDWNIVSSANEAGESFQNKYFKLANDLTGIDKKIGIYVTPFAGSFDGDGHSITINYFHGTGVANQGTFGTISSTAIIKNLTVKGTMTSTATGEAHMGGVVGYNFGGTIQNCNSYIELTFAGYQCAAIVGRTEGGSIINCNNYGTIHATSTATGNNSRGVAGIVGYANINGKTTITNCKNYGTIEAAGTQIGGIIGFANGSTTYVHEITNCENHGVITSSATINSTSNEGVGGIAGFALHTQIDGCLNDANITTHCSETAGIVGKLSDSSVIKNSTNSGTIIGQDQVGGFVGRLVGSSSVLNCTNTGTIKYISGTNHGQIYGYQNGATLSGNTESGSVEQYII